MGKRLSKNKVASSKFFFSKVGFPLTVTSEIGSATADVPFLSSNWKMLLQLRNGRPLMEVQLFHRQRYKGFTSRQYKMRAYVLTEVSMSCVLIRCDRFIGSQFLLQMI